MHIDSPRFGTLQVEPSRIIEFPVGLAGFEDCKRFTLLHPEENEPPFFILQSLDDPAVAFHIADPALYGFNFDVELSEDEIELLQLKDPAAAAVVVILSKGDDGSGPVRANLKAPLVLNLESRLGLQHVFGRLNFDLGNQGE
jgi:flagellar assembly factor FliW